MTGFVVSPIGSLTIGFVLGIFSGVAIRLLIDYILRPQLEIEGNDSIVVRGIRLHPENGRDIDFAANRIRVKNKGKSAATGCKVYVEYVRTPPRQNDIERGAWMIVHEQNAYTLTLNVKDREFVDLCAINVDGQIRVVPLEYGYSKKTIESCTRLTPGLDVTIIVRITSSNAKPTEKIVILRTNFNHFPAQAGRIVEFIK